MLFQHNMTVIHVYDHEEDYLELVFWLKEHADRILDMPNKDGVLVTMSPSIEKMFRAKFDIHIGE